MDLLTASINTAVVTVVGIVLAWLAKGRFDALERKIDGVESRLIGTGTLLDGRIDGMEGRLDERFDRLDTRLDGRFDPLETRFDGRFDRLETRLDGRIDALQSSMDAMRSDLTQVALAVGVRPRAQND